MEWGTDFSHLDFSFLKKGAVPNRRTTGIFLLECSQRTQCLLFFPGQKAFGAWLLGGCVQLRACPIYLPTCALEHKAPCLPSPTQMPPSPQTLPHVISAATASQSPRPGPKGGSCGRVSPRLCGDRRQRRILNHPVHEA